MLNYSKCCKTEEKKYKMHIIFFCLINLLSFINSFTLYTPLRTYSQKLFLVANDGIYLFNDKMEQLSKIKTFDKSFNAILDFSYILSRQYEQGDGYIFVKIKGNLYIYLEDQLICESTLEDYSDLAIDIILNNYQKMSDTEYIFYYIIATVNKSKNIIIEQRKLICSNSASENILIKNSSKIKDNHKININTNKTPKILNKIKKKF